MVREEVQNIEVGAVILKETTRCKKSFGCLNSNERNLCRAEGLLSNGLVKIECNEPNDCSYKTFMDSVFCACPTRIEIYKKYKI